MRHSQRYWPIKSTYSKLSQNSLRQASLASYLDPRFGCIYTVYIIYIQIGLYIQVNTLGQGSRPSCLALWHSLTKFSSATPGAHSGSDRIIMNSNRKEKKHMTHVLAQNCRSQGWCTRKNHAKWKIMALLWKEVSELLNSHLKEFPGKSIILIDPRFGG